MDLEEAEEQMHMKERMIDLDVGSFIEKARKLASVELPDLSDDGLVELAALFAKVSQTYALEERLTQIENAIEFSA